ncbi:homeobox protein cut-like 1 isoform X2 [Biomphalaria glabrata]|uniref:DNA-binding protein SATB n=1 Tax=Biomphalaria glabrata TaxID=6526 RepID=A0A9W2YFI4_BIOGL|nr:homeobox protein cut-like 1 isoform X2 [Biomphalaria glabrata]
MAANMQSMCQYWKNFDLQELQRELDTTATDLANRQDESEGSRKRLVEQSRDFKKNTPEDIRKVVAPLLKSFQVEIDSLSKRSKAAEAAFLSVYKKLIDLPDPVSVLEHAQTLQKKAQKVQDLEIENKQLRETLEEYNHEFAEVKNQEVTIKQLKEKLKEHEERIEATAQSRAKEKERELQRVFAEKERSLQETQLSVAKKLGEAEQQITSLHAALESAQSELFEVKAKYDEATTAKSDEMEMVMADLDRANERAANAERQVERLRLQLSQVTESLSLQAEGSKGHLSLTSEQVMDNLKRSTQEMELAAKEKEIAQLVEDVQRLQASLNKLRESTSEQVERLEKELSSKNMAFRALEEKLRSQEDYEEVKRELRVLKSIEFANAYTGPEEGKTLEMLLLEKNKSLQTESTHLKVVNAGLTESPTTSPSTITTTTTSSSIKWSALTKLSSSIPSSSTTAAEASLTPSQPLALDRSSSSSSTSSSKSDSVSRTVALVASNGAISSPPVSAVSAVKQEVPSPVSSTPRLPPYQPIDSIVGYSGSDSFLYRMPSTPSSGRHSPNTNCKLSPDIPTPSQTPHANSLPPQSSITLPPHLDPRNFAPPMSPFYGFPGSPFHPAFLPLNMVKSEVNTSPGGLDTGYVAKNVRELLSIHNIGQRLFAKHVLGLSQGTVSELLSKPKSWDKLTEKGRESYRKMHAWATDENNIMALKAISPKKGTQPLTPNNSYKEKEDSVTEERIANILNEAQVAMHMKKSMEQQQVANAVVSSIYHHELSKMGGAPPGLTMISPTMPPTSLSNGPHYPRDGSRKSRDSESRQHMSSSAQEEAASAQELVSRIYRRELENLKKAADAAGNIAASAMYSKELSRLNNSVTISSSSRHQQNSPPSPPQAESPQSPLALDCRSTRPNGLRLKTEPPDSTSEELASQTNNYGAIDLSKPSSQSGSTPDSSPSSESGRHAGSAFFLVRPRGLGVNGHDSNVSNSPLTPTPQQQQNSMGGPRYGSVPPAECLSPLQRMQNIANSLTTRPPAGMPNTKPLRAVLPPITQEEFDRYANMNTDDLVKKVKETLSQYSISQRLFGESVLGLSQGSVSDLLARPKPWHMLTQKGREPFIRMQIFLEDADSIPKLVASQYRIPPDKLMRSNSRGSTEPAHRRRKSSLEDRNFDSPTQPKRPRVFFTEDQKDSLRQAYAQDPYPNQSTIETLAKSLNVGVKTVINWFHNHRMRAKQQHHAGGESNIKSEPDESSNQSDISSMSGDVTSNLPSGQFYHGGITPTELNQWMFPQFEPMSLMHKLPPGHDDEDNKENNGGLEDDEDDLDEPDGMDATSSNNNNNLKVKEEEEENRESESRERRPSGEMKSEDGLKSNASSESCLDSRTSAAVSSSNSGAAGSVNKRKRSNPQRIFEGAQLDRTFGMDKSQGLIDETAELLRNSESSDSGSNSSGEEKQVYIKPSHCHLNGEQDTLSHYNCEDASATSSGASGSCVSSRHTFESGSVHRIQRIEKIQKAIKSPVEHWDDDDEDEDRSRSLSSIQKLQKHIETNSTHEDWDIL